MKFSLSLLLSLGIIANLMVPLNAASEEKYNDLSEENKEIMSLIQGFVTGTLDINNKIVSFSCIEHPEKKYSKSFSDFGRILITLYNNYTEFRHITKRGFYLEEELFWCVCSMMPKLALRLKKESLTNHEKFQIQLLRYFKFINNDDVNEKKSLTDSQREEIKSNREQLKKALTERNRKAFMQAYAKNISLKKISLPEYIEKFFRHY